MQIKKGKALGAQKGLTDKLNGIIWWYDQSKAGKGFEFGGADFTEVRYNVLLEGGQGINVTCGGNGQPYIISLAGQSSGGGGELSATGTDGSTATGSNIIFASAADSNVTAHVSQDGAGNIRVELGVYYI